MRLYEAKSFHQTNNFRCVSKKDSNAFFGAIHIRLQQRNGRKSITTVQGLNSSLDFEKINRFLKKEFCCNGCVIEDAEMGTVIQLQGDQRNNLTKFLIQEGITLEKLIKVHGT